MERQPDAYLARLTVYPVLDQMNAHHAAVILPLFKEYA
jgi:hypothetical protein